MYMLPQEVEVWYIIPSVRKELSKMLIQEHGFSYEKAGRVLGISKAAVSQYISNKRGNKVQLDEKTLVQVKRAAKVIAENQKRAVHEIQGILAFMKSNRQSCAVCKTYNKEVLAYCNCDPTY